MPAPDLAGCLESAADNHDREAVRKAGRLHEAQPVLRSNGSSRVVVAKAVLQILGRARYCTCLLYTSDAADE